MSFITFFFTYLTKGFLLCCLDKLKIKTKKNILYQLKFKLTPKILHLHPTFPSHKIMHYFLEFHVINKRPPIKHFIARSESILFPPKYISIF